MYKFQKGPIFEPNGSVIVLLRKQRNENTSCSTFHTSGPFDIR